MASDGGGYASVNPLFMKYTPSNGEFSGQLGYGYRSLEAFILAVQVQRCREESFHTYYKTIVIIFSFVKGD